MTNYLPLDLKLINYVFDPYQTPLTLKGNMRQQLCQWICNVNFRYNSFHSYISSGYDLSNQVEPPQNVLRLLMRHRFVRLRNCPVVVANKEIITSLPSMTPRSMLNIFIQTLSFTAFVAAMHSAFVVESAIVSCLELFQHTALHSTCTHTPNLT